MFQGIWNPEGNKNYPYRGNKPFWWPPHLQYPQAGVTAGPNVSMADNKDIVLYLFMAFGCDDLLMAQPISATAVAEAPQRNRRSVHAVTDAADPLGLPRICTPLEALNGEELRKLVVVLLKWNECREE